MKDNDTISRQAAIDAFVKYVADGYAESPDDYDGYMEIIKSLPTAEKKGEWIPCVDGNYIVWECSECHVESEAWTDFCPICGSRNIEEMDDDGTYEEALEEFRKNPKTYTLGEVEAELGLTAEKKGKWIVYGEFIDCSVCRKEKWSRVPYEGLVRGFRYCPKCGARMDANDD